MQKGVIDNRRLKICLQRYYRVIFQGLESVLFENLNKF